LLLAVVAPHVNARQQQQQSRPPQSPQTYAREGVSVEFSVEPAAGGGARELSEGADATVRFKITDAARTPLANLRPTAWVSRRGEKTVTDARACREKIQSFLQSTLSARPDIDLNSYFILTLNQEPNISVIDPLSGFGTTKLYTLVPLSSPGEDWVLSRDRKRLYVSMPLADEVAVIDPATWKVLANVGTGARPSRVALQHDERYLWVGDDGAAGGVTVIDTATLKVAARLATGAGHHEVALSDDDRYAFVTNRQDGTLSVIDVRKLAKVRDIKTGALPAAVAFSSLSRTVYVANDDEEGTVAAVSGAGHEVVARMKTRRGLRAMRFMPGDRFGFVVNGSNDTVYIFDVSTNRVVYAAPVGPGPDQITFTRDFAYVRSTGSEFVTMINVTALGRADYKVAVTRFPAGQKAPAATSLTSLADAVTPAPEAGAVLVANPADRMIYFYTEGMAAPMGSFQNYRREPRALLVLDNSLRETAPGVYTTTVRLTGRGQYDVAFLLDSPRMVNCFDLAVKENPALPKTQAVAVKVEPLTKDEAIRVGETYSLRFRVTDAGTRRPRADLQDMGVLVFLAPGIWQERQWAKSLGDGVYEMRFVPPQEGVYYVYFQVPSLGVQFNQLPQLILQAVKGDAASGASGNRP
jgi:YVTN family beta-propeller protein